MNETVCPECGCWAGHAAACTFTARHFSALSFTSSDSIRLSNLEVCYNGRLIDHHRRDLGPCPECASRNYDKGDISRERENLDIPTPSTRNNVDISNQLLKTIVVPYRLYKLMADCRVEPDRSAPDDRIYVIDGDGHAHWFSYNGRCIDDPIIEDEP